ncbi:MAG: F0F1 ATP synthase subunit B [Chloroflexi bacterium]|nr:F0F1 ATP synthase subunit B [Chloroflexota bacterium]MDA1146563.1 F0F1 ATP synthase subunit B [Chloroflexota bacterium]
MQHPRMTWLRSRRFQALAIAGVLAAVPSVASATEEVEGIAALGLNLPGLVAQLVNFTILLVVLRLFLWKPILKVLDERKHRIEEGLQRSEQAATQAAASEEEARRVIEEARAEAREATARAQEQAGRLREELEQQARREADQIVSRAREEIALEREQAVQQLRSEFADLTIRAAERVVGQAIDRDAHQRLIDEALVEARFGQDGNN